MTTPTTKPTTQKNVKKDRKRKSADDNNSIDIGRLAVLKEKFYEDNHNKLIQNSLCSNILYKISEVREYMQSRDCEFSHTLDPELVVSNQGLSGRCWLFALLNVMRHEMVRKYHLQHDFELSESYICFYEKLEKCNFFLTKFMGMDKVDARDYRTQKYLLGGCQDGGYWSTCANLIKKYGVIPKSCYRESFNSHCTEIMNDLLNYKLKEYALQLTGEKDHSKRESMKKQMMDTIYDMLCKFLGTPPNPNEKFKWSFGLYLGLSEQLQREAKRSKTNKYENLQIKQSFELTPLEFYESFVVNKLDDYMKFGNDPRNEYHKFYTSYEEDSIVEGDRTGFFNVPIEEISDMCIRSIVDNTPVEFDCDVVKYLNPQEELMDTNGYDYNIVFKTSFTDLSKKQMLECLESYPNHAMVLVGVDLDQNNKPRKWKVENSWGRGHSEEQTGYYTMSHEWFQKFVYNAVIQNKYVPRKITSQYNKAIKNPTVLPENDILGS
jgi:bleomycin hydrolase